MSTAPSTLMEVMRSHAESDDSEHALHCWNPALRAYSSVTYSELSKRAFAFGERLQSQGARAGRVIMIACHSPYATLVAFYGTVSIGAIPMIFPMPLSLGSHEALVERIQHWGLGFNEPAMLVLEEGLNEKFHEFIPPEVSTIRLSETVEGDWNTLEAPVSDFRPNPDDVAFFQTTSSSTGDHKAVAISHGNIIANVRGIRKAVHMDNNESMVSWLPLFHDMGLVGAVLFCFCNDYPLHLMTPTQFVKRPAMWLRSMNDYGCTIATAPNFGYDHCARLISDKDVSSWNLQHVKHLFVGAEPIRVSTISSFIEKFKPAGIRPEMIRPAYGLAESTIITSISLPEHKANFIELDANSIAIGKPVQILDRMNFDGDALKAYVPETTIAACTAGHAIEDLQFGIVDEDGEAIDSEGVAGEIVISGSSVAMGYVTCGDAANEQLIDKFSGGQLRTGDIGVILDGELYILERIKNIIIRNGENYLVSALEEKIAILIGASHEHIAVFEADIRDPNSDIVVLVERQKAISESEVDSLLVGMPKESFPITKILISRSRIIPRTTSGKKRHFYCRQPYKNDEILFQQSIDVSPERILLATENVRNAKSSV